MQADQAETHAPRKQPTAPSTATPELTQRWHSASPSHALVVINNNDAWDQQNTGLIYAPAAAEVHAKTSRKTSIYTFPHRRRPHAILGPEATASVSPPVGGRPVLMASRRVPAVLPFEQQNVFMSGNWIA